MARGQQARNNITVLLEFVDLCVDAVTQAIYRAYDDKADISQ